jgi:hypothetical protein
MLGPYGLRRPVYQDVRHRATERRSGASTHTSALFCFSVSWREEGDVVSAAALAGHDHWRIEHDFRERKAFLGLDHFEGRIWSRRRSACHPGHRWSVFITRLRPAQEWPRRPDPSRGPARSEQGLWR